MWIMNWEHEPRLHEWDFEKTLTETHICCLLKSLVFHSFDRTTT